MSDAAISAPDAAATAVSESRVSLGQAIWLIGRSLAYVRPFGGRFFAKWCFYVLSMFPALIMPWPLKLLTDNVILHQPITADTVDQYPGYIQWAIAPMQGWAPPQIALAVILTGVGTVVLLGLFGQSDRNTINGCALVWDAYEDILDACQSAWRFLIADPDRIRSIGTRQWACVSL